MSLARLFRGKQNPSLAVGEANSETGDWQLLATAKAHAMDTTKESLSSKFGRTVLIAIVHQIRQATGNLTRYDLAVIDLRPRKTFRTFSANSSKKLNEKFE